MAGTDSANKAGGRFQYYLAVKSLKGFATVREMKYTSQHCCDKTMDDRIAIIANNETIRTWRKIFGVGFDMLFSELYKIMVNKITFEDFRGWSPQSPSLGSAPVARQLCGSRFIEVSLKPQKLFSRAVISSIGLWIFCKFCTAASMRQFNNIFCRKSICIRGMTKFALTKTNANECFDVSNSKRMRRAFDWKL